MPGAIHIPSDHPSPDRPAKAHSRRTAKSTAVSSAPSCKQTPKSSLDGPSAKLLVVGTMQKYGVVFRSDSGKVPWWLIRLACLESADPFIQLCLAPSLSMKTSTWRSRSNPPQQDKAKLYGNTSASKTRFCLTPPDQTAVTSSGSLKPKNFKPRRPQSCLTALHQLSAAGSQAPSMKSKSVSETLARARISLGGASTSRFSTHSSPKRASSVKGWQGRPLIAGAPIAFRASLALLPKIWDSANMPLIALMKLVTRPCQIEATPSVRKVRRGSWNLKALICAGRLGPWIPTKLDVT